MSDWREKAKAIAFNDGLIRYTQGEAEESLREALAALGLAETKAKDDYERIEKLRDEGFAWIEAHKDEKMRADKAEAAQKAQLAADTIAYRRVAEERDTLRAWVAERPCVEICQGHQNGECCTVECNKTECGKCPPDIERARKT